MATALEECSTEKQHSVLQFLWAKGLNAKYIHKDVCPAEGETHLSRKEVHNWIEKLSQGRSKIAGDEMGERKWLRQESKDFYAAGFDALVKSCDKCINVGGRYVEKYILGSNEFYIHL
jgi:hypothetical protein